MINYCLIFDPFKIHFRFFLKILLSGKIFNPKVLKSLSNLYVQQKKSGRHGRVARALDYGTLGPRLWVSILTDMLTIFDRTLKKINKKHSWSSG